MSTNRFTGAQESFCFLILLIPIFLEQMNVTMTLTKHFDLPDVEGDDYENQVPDTDLLDNVFDGKVGEPDLDKTFELGKSLICVNLQIMLYPL